MLKFHWIKKFNWRILLLRILINAVLIFVICLFLPKVYITGANRLLALFWLALIMGVLNAFIKPLIEFLTLPFIFATYGIVVILINTAILVLLAYLTNQFVITSWLWAFIGGALMGILSSALESLMGVSPPILPEKSLAFQQIDPALGIGTKSALLHKIEPKNKDLSLEKLPPPVENLTPLSDDTSASLPEISPRMKPIESPPVETPLIEEPPGSPPELTDMQADTPGTTINQENQEAVQ